MGIPFLHHPAGMYVCTYSLRGRPRPRPLTSGSSPQ
jgi:hypothetical protein